MGLNRGIKRFLKHVKKNIVHYTAQGLIVLLAIREAITDKWYVWLTMAAVGILNAINLYLKESESEGKSIQFRESFDKLSKDFSRLVRHSESQEVRTKETINFLKEQVGWKTKLQKQTEKTSKIVTELIDRGLITNDDIVRNMEDSNVYFLYCYAMPYIPRKYSHLKERFGKNRLYPPFLNKIGFVRLPHQEVFLTTEKKIKPKFRELSKLREYLLKEIDKLFKKEWKTLLKDLSSDREFVSDYRKLSKKKYRDVYKISIFLIRGKLSEKNLGRLNDGEFTKEIKELLTEEVVNTGLDLPEEKKTEIRKFVVSASIEHIFKGIPATDLAKIKKLEPTLKQELEIDKITDYSEKSLQDITKRFERVFSKNKASKYSKLLKKKSSDYNNALKELGISV